MIKRNGFVSNSSSSSFILGYGIIKDRQKFNKYVKKNKINLDQHHICVVDKGVSLKNWQKTLSVSNSAVLDIKSDLINKGDLLIVSMANNEGDDYFSIYDESGKYVELDYSVAEDIGFYDKKQQAIIRLLNNEFIIDENNSECMYGAERNG